MSLRIDTTIKRCFQIAEERGFHTPSLERDWLDERTYRQLSHLSIEVGELADIFRKTGELSLEEAADVFIVLADLVGTYDRDGKQFEVVLKEKIKKNEQRKPRYGLH